MNALRAEVVPRTEILEERLAVEDLKVGNTMGPLFQLRVQVLTFLFK